MITIDLKALAYIQRKGGHLTLSLAEATAPCGTTFIPKVDLGRPRQRPEAYRPLAQDGITIHVDQDLSLAACGALLVRLTGLPGWRSVTLSSKGGASE